MNLGDTVLEIAFEIEGFPQKVKYDVVQYVMHHEWSVALETVCRVIKREKLAVPWETYKKVITVGTKMGLNPDVWEDVLFFVKKYLNMRPSTNKAEPVGKRTI
ncbi:hypothetical protein [Candidatus Formimonas warabiya]|nr:hypothetical protein [Candidatus Formimonas warabiya]